MAKEKPKPKQDRVVYSTTDRYVAKGLKAHASSAGWTWLPVAEGGSAHYVSMGVPEKHKSKLSKSDGGKLFHRCPDCTYAEASIIGPVQEKCPWCKANDAAIADIEFQNEYGFSVSGDRIRLGAKHRVDEIFDSNPKDAKQQQLTTTRAMRRWNLTMRKNRAQSVPK